jgi:subtilisin family serine protease
MAEPEIDPATSKDSGMHGTRVAGIIGAVTNNSIGLSGFSHNNNFKVMAVRFGFDTFSEIKAINFAQQNAAKVINASYAGPDFSQLEKDAICNFSGVFVTAAGNETANNDTTPSYPANQDCPNVISVAATDKNDALSTFSNYGATTIDIAAPGQSITTIYFDSNTSYVGGVAGTSIATPMVSGAVALIANKFPTMTNAQLKNIILASGDTFPSPTDAAKILSGKRLNVQAALALAIGDITSPASPSSLLVQ